MKPGGIPSGNYVTFSYSGVRKHNVINCFIIMLSSHTILGTDPELTCYSEI